MAVKLDARKLKFILGIVGVIGLAVIAVIGVSVGFSGSASASSACTTSGLTASKPFYADLAPDKKDGGSTNQFGQTQTFHDASTAKGKLKTAIGCDYYLAATEIDFAKSGSNVSVAEINTTAKIYGEDKKAWTDAVQGFLDSGTWSTKYESKDYDTLGMIAHGKDQPSVFSTSENHAAGWVLVLKKKDGAVREFRIICFFQPVETHFGHIPPAPPTKCKVSSTHTCGSTPTPKPSGPCKVCENKPQPVPHVSPTAKPTAPKRNPTKPADPKNPPSPTPGGYGGGSTSQPGQNGPPDKPLPTATATGDPGGF